MPLTIEAGVKTKVSSAVGVAAAVDASLTTEDLLTLILVELIRQTESGRGNAEIGHELLEARMDDLSDILDATK